MSESFMRGPDIWAPKGLIPVSRSTFYAKIKTSGWPAPVRLSARISAWRKSDIDNLIARLSGVS